MSNFGVQQPQVDPHFVHLLTRWDNEVRSVEKQGWDAQKTAQEFAKLGLSSALLLNAGALLALPPLMQWLSFQGRQQVASEAFWFLLGVIATALAIVITYTNWMFIKEEEYTRARKRAYELDLGYQGKDFKVHPDHIAAVKRLGVLKWVVNCTAWAAVICAVGAFAFFGIGAFKFISLAERNAIAPLKIDTVGPIKPTPA